METTRSTTLPQWVAFAAIACLTSATMVLLMKYVGTRVLRNGATTTSSGEIRTLVLYSFGVLVLIGTLGAICGLLLFFTTAENDREGARVYLLRKLRAEPALWGVALAIAALVLCTQLALFASINLAPNPGYAHIIVNLNVIVVLLVAALLFGSALSWVSGLGVAVAIGGIILVVCGGASL